MRNRSILSRKLRRSKRSIEDIDITSLMDVLTILLVFLLKNFNASGVVVNVPQGLELPYSDSSTLNNPGVIIQATNDKIWVDDELVVDFEDARLNNYGVYGQEGLLITPLFDVLSKKKIEVEELAKTVENAQPFTGKINLVLDKTLNYSFIRKILHTSAFAQFNTYQFIVLTKD